MGTSTSASRSLIFVAFSALFLWSGFAQAAPQNGFGFTFGAIHSSDSELYGTSRGSAFGVDVQMAVNDDWSLNPYLTLSFESTDASYNAQNFTAGLQARRWLDHWFFAGEFFERSLLIRSNSTYYGGGLGLAGGWEGDDHWSVELEVNGYEKSTIGGSNLRSDRSDVRVVVGYRWY